MSVTNIVGSALASASSAPVQKPSAPRTQAPATVPASPVTPVQTKAASQPLGATLLASLLQVQGGRNGDADGITGAPGAAAPPSGRQHLRGTLETGTADPSRPVASAPPPGADVQDSGTPAAPVQST